MTLAFRVSDVETYFMFLDELRSTGKRNMFGVRPILADQFDLSLTQSSSVLSGWMKTFDATSSVEDRVRTWMESQ